MEKEAVIIKIKAESLGLKINNSTFRLNETLL